jgi:hypothetical protein
MQIAVYKYMQVNLKFSSGNGVEFNFPSSLFCCETQERDHSLKVTRNDLSELLAKDDLLCMRCTLEYPGLKKQNVKIEKITADQGHFILKYRPAPETPL